MMQCPWGLAHSHAKAIGDKEATKADAEAKLLKDEEEKTVTMKELWHLAYLGKSKLVQAKNGNALS